MKIGELAKSVGVSVATIRYYEQEGLIEKPARSDSNYRRYGSETVTRLGFIRQCRSLGISLTEIRRLLQLAEAPDANCAEVDVLLDEHISNVRDQRRNLVKLERELKTLRADCHPSRQVRGCGILRDSALLAQSKGRKFEHKSDAPAITADVAKKEKPIVRVCVTAALWVDSAIKRPLSATSRYGRCWPIAAIEPTPGRIPLYSLEIRSTWFKVRRTLYDG